MWACAAPDCENNLRTKKFFPFPTDENRRKLWILRCHVTSVTGNAKLCEDHFDKSQFLLGQDVKKLKQDAVPTLFLDSSRIQSTMVEAKPLPVKKKPQNKTKLKQPSKPQTFPPLFSDPIRIQTVKEHLQLIEVLSDSLQSNCKPGEPAENNVSKLSSEPTAIEAAKEDQQSSKECLQPAKNDQQLPREYQPPSEKLLKDVADAQKLISTSPTLESPLTRVPCIEKEQQQYENSIVVRDAQQSINSIPARKVQQSKRKSRKPMKVSSGLTLSSYFATSTIHMVENASESDEDLIKDTAASKQNPKKQKHLGIDKYSTLNTTPTSRTHQEKNKKLDKNLLHTVDTSKRKRKSKLQVENYIDLTSELDTNNWSNVTDTRKGKSKKLIQNNRAILPSMPERQTCVIEKNLVPTKRLRQHRRKFTKYENRLTSFSDYDNDSSNLALDEATVTTDKNTGTGQIQTKQKCINQDSNQDLELVAEINVNKHAQQHKRKSVALEDRITELKKPRLNLSQPGNVETHERNHRSKLVKVSSVEGISDYEENVTLLKRQKNSLIDDIERFHTQNKIEFPKRVPTLPTIPKAPLSMIKLNEANSKWFVPFMKQWNEMLKAELLNVGEKYKTEILKNEVLLESQLEIEAENRKLKQESKKVKERVKELVTNNDNYFKMISELEKRVHILSNRLTVQVQRLDLGCVNDRIKQQLKESEIKNKNKQLKQLMKDSRTNTNRQNKFQIKEFESENENELLKQQMKALEFKSAGKKLKLMIKEFENKTELGELKLQINELESVNITMIEENESMLEEIQHYIKNNKKVSEALAEKEKLNSTISLKLKDVEKDNEAMSKKILELERELKVIGKSSVDDTTQLADIISENKIVEPKENIRSSPCDITQLIDIRSGKKTLDLNKRNEFSAGDVTQHNDISSEEKNVEFDGFCKIDAVQPADNISEKIVCLKENGGSLTCYATQPTDITSGKETLEVSKTGGSSTGDDTTQLTDISSEKEIVEFNGFCKGDTVQPADNVSEKGIMEINQNYENCADYYTTILDATQPTDIGSEIEIVELNENDGSLDDDVMQPTDIGAEKKVVALNKNGGSFNNTTRATDIISEKKNCRIK